jgi:hypothetical protein
MKEVRKVDKVGRREGKLNEEEEIRKIIKTKEGIVGGRRGEVERDEVEGKAERGHQWEGREGCFRLSWA